MKIAHVCPFYSPAIGGVKQVVEELAKLQLKEGHEVHVYTSDWDKEKRIEKKEEIIEGVYVHRCFHILKIANFASIWPSVFSKLIKQDLDIIHSHVFGHFHFVLASFAAKIKKIPHIHTTHCPWTDANRSFIGRVGMKISYNTLSRICLHLTNKIISITPWELSSIEKYGGNKEKTIVIPNGMEDCFFEKIKNNDFKKNLGIKGQMVLFFGRLNVTKGPDNFVKVAKMVLKEKGDVTFVIRGPDEGLKSKVEKLIGNEKRIILLEECRDRKEIIKMYQSADVFVLPSFREGLPLTLFEAMAAGLPIIASPVNGIPYEMNQPENGFLVEYGKNKEYKEKIIAILEDDSLRKKISENNLKKSKNYTWKNISQRTLEVYSSEINQT